MFTLALTAIGLSTAHAACGSSQRISDGASACLEAETWSTGSWFERRYHYEARNLCHDLGKMVAKVDIEVISDRTLTFNYGETGWKSGSVGVGTPVRNVTCCSDLSTVCNPEDLVTAANCEARWFESEAEKSCDSDDAVHTAHPDDSRCEIGTNCLYWNNRWRPTSAHTHYHHVYRLKNCNGHLRQNC